MKKGVGKIKIEDDSGDRRHFTIIPNYIANHSTANDQALYFQMKRYAGEEGQCFATEETLMSKLGIGEKALHKSLTYLTTRGWIEYVGTTKGKTRPIKTYRVKDIWKMNSDYYEKIPAESGVSIEVESPPKSEDTRQKRSKIPAESRVEEEPSINKNHEEENPSSLAAAGVSEVMKIFVEAGSAITYGNTTQRKAAERLIARYGLEDTKRMAAVALELNGRPYAPVTTTPYEFEKNIMKLKAYFEKERSKSETKLPKFVTI